MSAEKNDKPEAAAAPAAPAPADGAAPKGGGIMGFLPLIIALVLAPVISWVVAEFVLLPRFRAQLTTAAGAASAGAAGEHAAAEPTAEPKAESKAEPKKEGKKPEGKKAAHGGATASAEGPGSYRFEDVVVNLSGTMGTRYLKTSFLVTGKENIRELFEERQPQLLDATLNTLGSLTLADLEEVGSRNLIRARLIAAYNEVIGVRIVDQIYFSDFVVQ
ncbi:MAG: flagellar basal body-associated FliL family protein [Opitutaceae bacterium]